MLRFSGHFSANTKKVFSDIRVLYMDMKYTVGAYCVQKRFSDNWESATPLPRSRFRDSGQDVQPLDGKTAQ